MEEEVKAGRQQARYPGCAEQRENSNGGRGATGFNRKERDRYG